MPSYASVVKDSPPRATSSAVVYPDEPNDQDTSFASFGESPNDYDYTEGAKESEIAEAIEIRGRGSGGRFVRSPRSRLRQRVLPY
jgi:hypothetical protein